jgi:NADPH-dependent ferric siderophore reductase
MPASAMLGDFWRRREVGGCPPGRGHVYIAAEVKVALAIRDELLTHGYTRDQVSAKGYWSRGRPNANRGEPDEPT